MSGLTLSVSIRDILRSDLEAWVCPESARQSVKAACEHLGYDDSHVYRVLKGERKLSRLKFRALLQLCGRETCYDIMESGNEEEIKQARIAVRHLRRALNTRRLPAAAIPLPA